jgi:ABC-2 type transport system permease protein
VTGLLAFVAVAVRRLAVDRAALFLSLALPVVVITIIGTAFGQDRVDVGVVRTSGGAASTRLDAALRDTPGVAVHRYASVDALRRAARRLTIDAGVVLDPALDDAVLAGRTARVPVVQSPNPERALTARLALESALARAGAPLAAARFATARAGGAFTARLAVASALAPRGAAVRNENVGGGRVADVSRFSLTAPQNLVLFVFITALATGSLVVNARRSGILRRATATPTGPWTILAGLGLGWLAIALLQSAIIMGVGALVFGVSWGSPLPAVLLVVDFALVGCGAGLLVGAIGRDEDRVSALTPIVGIVLGALGGCMVPLEVFPSSMRAVAHATPHYWAIRSWQELVFDGAGLGTIATALAVLAGLAVLLTGAAAVLLHRDVTR